MRLKWTGGASSWKSLECVRLVQREHALSHRRQHLAELLIRIAGGARTGYPDVYTHDVLAALEALAPLDARRYELMAQRIARRAERARDRRPIEFLPEDRIIDGTDIKVADARAGRFEGAVIPPTCSASGFRARGRPRGRGRVRSRGCATSPTRCSRELTAGCSTGRTRVGQIETMSLDNQRNLKLMIAEDPAVPLGGRAGGWAR